MSSNQQYRGVLVCGLPGSGNRLLRDYLHVAGVDAVVAHGKDDDDLDRSVRAGGRFTHAVMPVRHPARALQSARMNTEKGHTSVTEASQVAMTAAILSYLAEHRIPTRMISYEALCAEPTEVLDDLCAFVGVQYREPSDEIMEPVPC